MSEHYEVSEYTVEDFAQADLATRGAGELARRMDPEGWLQWKYAASDGSEGWRADERMAAEGWVPVLVEPRSNILDDLAAAWEAAEVPTDDTPIREGDVVIVRHGGGFTVEPADRILSGQTHGRERILSRAPKREPWADLGDKLAVEMPGIEDEPRIEALAKALYCEHGVRVTGGDE